MFSGPIRVTSSGSVTHGTAAQRLDLQLPDPLPGEREARRDLGQRVLPAVLEPVAGAHDARRPVVQVVEQPFDALPLQAGQDDVLRRGGVAVGDQVAEVRVAVVTDRGVQRDGVLRPADQLVDPLDGHPERRRDLLRLRVRAELTGELTGHVAHPVHVLDQVHRQSHRALLLRDGRLAGTLERPSAEDVVTAIAGLDA